MLMNYLVMMEDFPLTNGKVLHLVGALIDMVLNCTDTDYILTGVICYYYRVLSNIRLA